MIRAFSVKGSGRRVSRLLLTVLAGLSFGRCGGGSAGPTQPPVTQPEPPTPAPTALADPPLSLSCSKLPVGNPNAGCRVEGSEYVDIVDRAIRTLKSEQPGIFDGEIVKSAGQYYVGLIKILDREGICAEFDGEELAVTNRSTSSEQFHVLTSWAQARFGPGSYRTTCSPAVVPTASALAPLPPSPAGCSLPASREISCAREGDTLYIGDVTAAVEQVMKEKPELFDLDKTAPGTSWPAVKDIPAYHGAVAAALTAKGYCAKDDGEEIAVKKGSNAVSEQFDVNYQDRYVRLGPGIYRASCYPAAF
jgi:hypothetical protein